MEKSNYNLEDLKCIIGIICDMLDNNMNSVDSIGESFECWCENGDIFYDDEETEQAKNREDLMKKVAPYVDDLTNFLLGLYNDLEDNVEDDIKVNIDDFNSDIGKDEFYDLCKKSELPYFWELVVNRVVDKTELKSIIENIRNGYNSYMKPNINLSWELVIFDTETFENKSNELYVEGSKLNDIADLLLQGTKRGFLNKDEVISIDE